MSSTRWDPWGDIVSLREAMNNLLEDSFVSRGRPGGPATPATQGAVGLALDIKEMGEFFEVTASVPGVSPDNVEITVLGDRLRIRGERKEEAEQAADSGRWVLRERRYGAFERTVNLPTAVRPDAAAAEFKDGVLTIRLPKADEARPRTIPVRTEHSAAGISAPVAKEIEG
jgi:HSP20 family protein